ncbi:MAG: ATP-dependent helicase HrpB [Planctomycetaceae bacterium]|nr:ATP-dependent helicase HrpB [Planctomycetaceae bacterium]
MSPSLPIDELIPLLCDRLRERTSVVLKAPPGAGKTTRVPPAIVNAGLAGQRQVIVLQPRRVAARSTARRMAEERGCALGDDVGYQIRFERRASSRTRILVVTEGVLIRRLLDDPFLDGVGAVVLDEFHERHLDTDLALAMVRRVQQTVRPDLKLVVMSATLAAGRLQEYLEGAPVVECTVRTHSVDIAYVPTLEDVPLPSRAARSLRRLAEQTAGHLLAFLPGVGEILRTREELARDEREQGWQVLPLYGDLAPDEQDRVFQPGAQRKVILATNVAETSITIPGVTGVVDSGVARILEFDAASGLNRLVLRPIAQASADQRAGRAGRTAPGRCLRLWPEAAHRVRPAFEAPELLRVDLAGVVLQLRCWGEVDVRAFPWFEPPPAAALEHAEDLLRAINAIDDRGVTPLGEQLNRFPVHPRLARLIAAGAQRGHLAAAAATAALLSERDPFLRGQGRSRAAHVSASDVYDRIDSLREHEQTGRQDFDIGSIHREGARRLRQTAEQFERIAASAGSQTVAGDPTTATALPEALGRALLAAFPDRLVKRREPGSAKGLMVGGRGARLAETSAVRAAELFVAVDVDASGEDALVRQASGVERAWLPAEHLVTETVLEFDPVTERVQARKRTRWMDLILEESPAPLPIDDRVGATLAAAARANWPKIFPPEDPAVPAFLARVQCLRAWLPELDLPQWDDAALAATVEQIAGGCRSFAELRAAPWLNHLRAQLSPFQIQALDREAPERLQVPSGSRVAIVYELGKPPVLPVRIQEVFGWKETPRIAGGRVKLLLHLLSPNHRPQQITDDLKSFWTTAYQQVRGELRRRYPKHAWPEDPWTATAERRPQKKS